MPNANKVICSSCETEMYLAESINTTMGNLCKGCYNLFLDFRTESTKSVAKKALWLFLVPSLLMYLTMYMISSGSVEEEDVGGMIIFALFWCSIGAYNLVQNGFTEVGETVKRNYYKATFSSSDNVNVSEHSYNTYTTEQWFLIVWNTILFGIGLGVTAFLGPLVYIAKKRSYKKAIKEYDLNYDSDLKVSEKKISNDILGSYQGLLAQKALDVEGQNMSVVEGIEVSHIGYLFHNDLLYSAFGTENENAIFVEDVIYFMELYPDNNNYDIVDGNSNLYKDLYDEFSEFLK